MIAIGNQVLVADLLHLAAVTVDLVADHRVHLVHHLAHHLALTLTQEDDKNTNSGNTYNSRY